MKRRHIRTIAFLVLGLLILGGCKSNPAVRSHYALNTTRPDRPANAPSPAVLDVRRLTIDSAYESKGLVYRQGEALYDTDYYSEFLVAPAQLITDRIRNWMTDAELCARVLDSGSLMEPTHSLEGHITRLYGDYRDKDARKAIMEIRLYLISHKDLGQAILLGKSYEQSEPVDNPDGETLVNAFDACLVRILTELESDLKVTMH
jgi:cholesterol transport system auxiliary component